MGTEEFMKLNILLLLLISFTLIACTGPRSGKTDTKEEPAGVEVAQDDEGFEDDAQFVEEDEIIDDQELAEATETSDEVVSGTKQNMVAVKSQAKEATPVKIDTNAELATYTVGKNETLMLVAFKLYGDYRKWKVIAKYNMDILSDGQTISEGMNIKYLPPMEDFEWSPEGNPYLIKWGDSLSLISKNVYGVLRRWKDIWNNNKVLIRDPNKIYAGFTIYYVQDSKEVALK